MGGGVKRASNNSMQRTGAVAPINLTLRPNAGGVDGQDEGTEEGFSLHG